jgi:hypothetical protein
MSGGKVGVAAVRLLQRPVDVVAEGGRAKQRLLAVLPILDLAALGRRQPAFEHVALLAQPFDGRANLILPLDQGELGEEHGMLDVERGEVLADHGHHHGDGFGAHDRQPLRLRLAPQPVAVLGGKRRANRLEVIARIEPVRDGADVLTERLAVAQECGTRERIDLRAGVVDVVLARHRKSGERQQIGKRVAEHRTTAVPDVHGSGWVGGDIFDIDRLAGADAALAVVRTRADRIGERRAPNRRIERQVDEARAGDVDLGDLRQLAQLGGNFLGEIARF